MDVICLYYIFGNMKYAFGVQIFQNYVLVKYYPQLWS